MARKKSWSELSPLQRGLVVVGGVAEVVVTAYALRDLARRPDSGVKGSKAVWRAVMVVQPVGPVAYLCWGRKG